MPASLASYPCPDENIATLRDSLLPLYARLADIVDGKRKFDGFVETCELPVKFQMSPDVYPRLYMNFTQADLEILTTYASLNSSELLAQASTPLERLMIATIWKNGDLQKVRHIAEGLGYGLGRATSLDKKSSGPVFKQFGRHLAAPSEQPIADQHTLRAYRMLRDDHAGDKVHLKDTSTGDEIARYVAWVQRMAGGDGLSDRLHAFDRSMFALGSATKYVLSPPRRRKANT